MFFLVAGAIAGVALFLSVGVMLVFLALDRDGRPPDFVCEDTQDEEDEEENENTVEIDTGDLFRPPARTNFLLVGVDEFSLADAIMVGTFYRDSGNIHLMSIPRDTVARIPPQRMERMRANGIHPPQILKINEMRSYGGRLHGIYYLQEHIAELLSIDFEYYVEVQLDAFVRIVDVIGPIEMYIPQRLFYEDPVASPPLRINIPAGMQQLDGRMAEGVIRFRNYPMGALERDNVQLEFMTQLIKQMTTREALLSDPLAIINIVLSDVRSNIGLSAAKYIPYITNIGAESVSTFTMPGRIGHVGDREYFIPDTTRLPAVIGDVFHSVFEEEEDEEEIEEAEDDE
jgi:LCP family protein required for cell wall assembly